MASSLIPRSRFPQIKESFYAITPSRRFPNLILRELMKPKLERRRVGGG